MQHLIIALFFIVSKAYYGQWTWLSGSKVVNSAPYYGLKFEASTEFMPGSRGALQSCYNSIARKYYIFGGFGTFNTEGALADLWEYQPDNKTWTWLGGYLTPNIFGDYSTRLEFTDKVWPASRYNAEMVCDNSNNLLYLFGGRLSYYELDDIWIYNISSNQWKWIAGNNPAAANINLYTDVPTEAYTIYRPTFVSSSSRTSFYVAFGFYLSFTGYRNLTSTPNQNIWQYNYVNNEWKTINQEFAPSSRGDMSCSTNDLTDQIFCFGGSSSFSGDNPFNGLYMFDLETQSWESLFQFTEKQGSVGVYGVKGAFSSTAVPGGRIYAMTAINKAKNQFIMFGGFGVGSVSGAGSLGDLFIYDVTLGQWAFMSGLTIASTSQTSKFPLNRGEPCSTCHPGGRHFGSSFFDEKTSVFYVFGGEISYEVLGSKTATNIYFNELWSFDFNESNVPKITTSNHYSSFSASKSSPVGVSLSPDLTGANQQDKASTNTSLIAGIIVAAVIIAIAILTFFLRYFRKNKKNDTAKKGDLQLAEAGKVTIIFREIFRGEFNIVQKISAGTIGAIFLAESLSPALRHLASHVVVKQIGLLDVAVPGELRAAFDNEITIMSSLNDCKNCAKVLGYVTNPVSIVMKFYLKGSLKHYIAILPKRFQFLFVQDIALGIQSIHKKDYVHCDLKPENILIDDNGRFFCVITDFSLAKQHSNKPREVTTEEFSVQYAAPEVFPKNGKVLQARKPRDIYSFATIVYELLSKKQPW